MNPRYVLTALLAGLTTLAGAQDIRLNDLGAPSAPAFTVLGVQPNEINRPKSYKALETALLSSFSSGNALQVPSTFALEVTPYWLKSRDIDVNGLMNPGLNAFRQSLSFSLATARRPNLADSTRTVQQIGFGFRATLFPGQLTGQFDTDLQALTKRLRVLAFAKQIIGEARIRKLANEAALRTYLDARFGEALEQNAADTQFGQDLSAIQLEVVERTLLERRPTNEAQVRLVLNSMFDELSKTYETRFKLRELAKKVERHYFYRKGFRMDVAGATAVDFPTNDFTYSNLSKWAIWLTPSGSWVWRDLNLELLGVARYLANRIPANETHNWDVGARGVVTRRNLSVSVEYIHRFQNVILARVPVGGDRTQTTSLRNNDSRLAFNVTCYLSDRFALTYTLGKNFSLNTEFEGNLISLVGLNFGLNGPSVTVPRVLN